MSEEMDTSVDFNASELLIHEDSRGVVTATLNRPEKRNAFSLNILLRLYSLFVELEQTPSCQCLILRGACDTFCSGMDLHEALYGLSTPRATVQELGLDASVISCLGEDYATAPSGLIMPALVQRVMSMSISSRFPVVGVADGNARGGGVGLLCACDYVVASERFCGGLTETRLGFMPSLLLPFLRRKLTACGLQSASLSGSVFSARDAQRFGLAHRVVPSDLTPTAVDNVVGNFVLNHSGATSYFKSEMSRTLLPPEQEQIDALRTHWESWNSADGREGVMAFLEKRVAKFLLSNRAQVQEAGDVDATEPPQEPDAPQQQ
ncbi:MAG: enoyl-CoA hydratase/isomerase family protein [Planctomycetia bacterium]|nr:enoyl-CoA hydratase/isomerase family protein [Planctomycetia bacterium]